MSSLTSDYNSKTLDTVIKVRKNLNYIKKFGLLTSITQCIDSHFILNVVYIENSIIASDVKFNL